MRIMEFMGLFVLVSLVVLMSLFLLYISPSDLKKLDIGSPQDMTFSLIDSSFEEEMFYNMSFAGEDDVYVVFQNNTCGTGLYTLVLSANSLMPFVYSGDSLLQLNQPNDFFSGSCRDIRAGNIAYLKKCDDNTHGRWCYSKIVTFPYAQKYFMVFGRPDKTFTMVIA